MQRVARAAAGALARCADAGLGAAGASSARVFHTTGSAWDALSHVHRSGMSATTVLCVRKGDMARPARVIALHSVACRTQLAARPRDAPALRRHRSTRVACSVDAARAAAGVARNR